LAELEGLESTRDLYKVHTRPLCVGFKDTYPIWGTHSVERLVFDVVILEAGR